MKRYGTMAASLLLLAFAACKTSRSDSSKGKLETTMSVTPHAGVNQPVMLHFVVYNPTKSELQFCKYHTPFEGFLSTFLDLKSANGREVEYRGAMAKRMMPPPASAYIKVPAKDSVVVDIDITKGYNLKTPGLYTAKYNSGAMSGLEKVNEITFTVVR
ncbi:hypothetical protein MKQ70_03960 [Chitinophaga sedimenti]|uniref:hypothetical protein n=1 Tax=Chitinophaga sedimenti TaxID=2033606 RepID=UPI0020050247|nr:hypothetical protein [Chitinophaga sedimenti]MCK7554209.1 hypothetical protein [Chitinophaga sedimenti]